MKYFDDIEVGDATEFGNYDVTREEVLELARMLGEEISRAGPGAHWLRRARKGSRTRGAIRSPDQVLSQATARAPEHEGV